MFDRFSVISKHGTGWRVQTREGVWAMEPQTEVHKAVPNPDPVKKTVDEGMLARLVEEVVSATVDEVLNPDTGVTDLRQDLAGLTDSLDAAGETLDALQQDNNELQNGVFGLIDNAASIMKFTGVTPRGRTPLNLDDALAASLSRRRGR
jgi:hypothetical protein